MKHLLGQQVVNRQRFQQAYNKTKAELLEERRDNVDLRKELHMVCLPYLLHSLKCTSHGNLEVAAQLENKATQSRNY